MGQVIKIDTQKGVLPDALTRAGQRGFLSRGYLADEPATAVLTDDETPQYVLTNRRRGVTVESGETSEQIKPDSGYRTVAVVTDRRLVVLVGTDDGDQRAPIALSEITAVDATSGIRTGQLTFERDGATWYVHTDSNGVDDVAEYLRAASTAWRTVTDHLDAADQTLTRATDRRQQGEYEQALTLVRSARDRIESARSVAIQFSTEHPGTAVHTRVQTVESQRRQTAASIRSDSARGAAATGDRHCRERNYEAAREAYERARDAYDRALTLDDTETIRAERARIDRLLTELEQSPLREAVAADNRAVAADDPAVAATNWETALEAYRTALNVADDDRRFTGEPQQITDRIATVTESLTAAQRTVASDIMRAGDWYTDAGQYEAALDEFERALSALDTAISTAREWYPDAVDHLVAEREALQQRIDRTTAALEDGADIEDRITTDVEPEYDISGTLGEVEGPTAIEDAIDIAIDDAGVPVATSDDAGSTIDRLRRLTKPALTDVVSDTLAQTVWAVQDAPARCPFDTLARCGEDLFGVVVHVPETVAVEPDTVEWCASVTGAAGTDRVLLATAARVPETVLTLASEEGVRLLRGESLAAIVDTQGVSIPATARRLDE